ncbi:MAG: hypothetical protein K2X35_17360 [Bryobacteraceae bacterium]|nr:hypothetical protein [Bryobacteraceae bacterium]
MVTNIFVKPFQARNAAAAALVVSGLWISIGLAFLAFRAPFIDEAFYSMAAANWLRYGNFDLRQVESSSFIFISIDRPLTRIDQHAYWYMPLQSLIQGAWYWMVGFGLDQQRLLTLICAVVSLVLWHRVVWRITSNPIVSLAAVFLIAFDLAFVTQSSWARPDMMGHMFGLAAFYFHIRFLLKRPLLARVLSCVSLCACATVHPVAFFVWLAVYLAQSLRDRRQLSWSQLAAFAAPGFIAACLFAWWASVDFQAFRDQTSANAGFRYSAFNFREWARYLTMYGLSLDTIFRVKSFGITGFLMIVVGAIASLRLWYSDPAIRHVFMLGATSAGTLAIAEGTKWGFYGLHAAPWIAVMASFFAAEIWKQRPGVLALGLALLYTAPPVGAAVETVLRDPRRTDYRAAVNVLDSISGDQLVFAPPEFLYQYSGPFLFDVRYGAKSGKRASAFAAEKEPFQRNLEWAAQNQPDLYEKMKAILKRCHLVFETRKYIVESCQ